MWCLGPQYVDIVTSQLTLQSVTNWQIDICEFLADIVRFINEIYLLTKFTQACNGKIDKLMDRQLIYVFV